MNIGWMAVLAGLLVMAQAVFGEATAAKDAIASVARGNNQFGIDLYNKLAAKEKGNLFFSPASIESALAMTCAGAAGETAKQMRTTLHLDDHEVHAAFGAWIDALNHPKELEEFRPAIGGTSKMEKVPAYQLVVANALWGQKGYPFKAEFTSLVAKNYGGAMNEVDFAKPADARAAINRWIEKQTRDRIKDMIPEGMPSTDTRLVLTNAVYFKSDWLQKFEKSATQDGDFMTGAGQAVKTPLMHQQKHFAYAETDDLQALELGYKGDELSMLIVLPKKPDGLSTLEQGLTSEKLDAVIASLKSELVKVTLPRWKFTTGLIQLNNDLKALGMRDAFDVSLANFSGMVTHEPLFISEVLHKAFVAVDEDGTEAAAATAVMMRAGAAMPRREEPKIFNADHPFLYVIRHRASGGILFMGRLANPKE